MSNEVTAGKPFSLAPQSIAEAMQLAEIMSKASIVPKDFIGNSGNILVAIQWGMELGLQPMQAMQSIAVINGRPSLWGDAVIALVRSSPLCEYVYESDDGNTATCRVKRRGEEEQSRTFSVDDAKTAGLFGKSGPWTSSPKRMRQMRARSFALRDVFPDVLRGMPVAEEVADIDEKDEKDVSPGSKSKAPDQPKTPYYSDADFQKNFPSWEKAIQQGKSPQDVIQTVQTRAPLTEEQISAIMAVNGPIEGTAERVE